MTDLQGRAAEAFANSFGSNPALISSAPGRINLIGEHTDYNEGFVLPIAIDRHVAAAIGLGDDEAFSSDFLERASLAPGATSWASYPAGVLAVFRQTYKSLQDGINVAFASDVPIGAGLSSSAAIECSMAVALSKLADLDIDRPTLARLCQKAENEYVGVQSGIMDQFASLLGKRSHALFLDCRSLEYRLVPFRPQEQRFVLLACNTASDRCLASSGYNERRATCERAAAELGLKSLRDATMNDLAKLSGEELKCARHVITENDRTLRSVKALEHNDFETFGALMYESHASLRYDYEVSAAQLDLFVESGRKSGALGARLTGAGFGGCAIALIAADRATDLTQSVVHQFAAAGFPQPTFYQFTASEGASVRSL